MKFHSCIEKIVNRLLMWHRKRVFEEVLNQRIDGLRIYGKVHLINKNVRLGRNITIYPEVQFFGNGPIDIGDNVSIGNGTIIFASKDGGVTIGDNTLISAQCYIIDSDHNTVLGKLIREQSTDIAKVTIGSDVWIAAGCKILKGSFIRNGSILGAMSLVKGIVPENSIAFGIPAAVKKYRT